MPTPRLELFPDRITANARSVMALCHAHGAQVAAVTKVTAAHPEVARALALGGADMLADSRVSNLASLKAQNHGLPLLLLRIPTPSQIEAVVREAQLSLNSSLDTLRALSEAAGRAGVRHQAIVMVDMGDLREGVWPDRAVDLVREAAKLPHLEILGLGCNLACYGGVIPSETNMRKLMEVREACRVASGLPLDLLSGGNSANLPLLASGKMPAEINHFRLGEAIILGRNVIDRSPWPGTRQDTCRLVAEVVELERKPSVPIGETGQDAFGGTPTFVDRGVRARAICNVGRQDVVVDGLDPVDAGMIVLGGSSDHLIVDVEEGHERVKVGDEIAFYPGYGALLALSTSPYVQKIVLPG
ncbi:MAG: alanine/ornithine racemase family PLP-dependent enzyme [Firmicutes bacterium]|nr:alanine/ornithine racemase family PLP-dependent enzyme [Bacillota bacterium]